MKAGLLSVLLLVVAASARADIIEWRDEHGVRHFTNVRGEVPGEYREVAQVVVDEVARREVSQATAEPEEGSMRTPAGHRGLRRGVRQARAEDAAHECTGGGSAAESWVGVGGGGGVVVNGPLAVAVAGGADGGAPYGGMEPFGGGSWGFDPYYYPLVTTSFDQGRSRHLTLRMLLQDQFAVDRAGPYMFVERLIPPFGYVPMGPRLSPVLARGLPNSVPLTAQVITR